MANFFDQFDEAPKTGNFFDQFDEKAAAPQEKSGFLRQVADVPLSIGRGAATGVRMIADAFGAGSGASEAIKGVEGYLSGLMSAQAKNDEKEVARIMKEAEDKGVLDQVKAGFKAFSVAPIDLLSQGLGTAAPAIIGVLGGKVLGAGALGMSAIGTGVGAGMGAGSAKGGIYEEVKATLKESGVDDAKAEQVAIEAQKYGGKNMDQILLSAGLGGIAGRFGLESSARRMLTGAVGKEAGKSAAREIAEGATRTAVTESVPELLQGSQEQVAKNIALQREGFDVPTMRGVAGSGTLEALAGAGLGAVTGGTEAGLRRQARGEADRILAEEEKARAAEEQARLDAEAPPTTQAAQPSPTQVIEDQAAELERQQQRQQAAMERARASGIGGGSEVNQTLLEQARIRKEQQERAAAAEEKAAEAERQRALRAERVRIGSTQYSGDPMMNEVLRSRAIAEFDEANAPKAPEIPAFEPTKTIEQTTPIEQPKDFNVLRGVDARNADLMSAVAERRAAEEKLAATQAKTIEAKKVEEAAKVDTSRADVDQRVAQVENFLMSPVRKTQQETADYMAGVIPEMQRDFLDLLDEDMNQPLTPEQVEALKTQIRQRLQPDAAPDEAVQRTPFKRFLAARGMNKKDVQDIFGENAYRANQQLPGAIRADGPRLDMLAEAAVEAGFLQNEDTEALVDMIKAEFGGDEQVSVDMAGDRAAAEYEARRESELEDRAAAIGLKTKGMTPDQVAARLDRIERKREEKRRQYSRNVDGFADLPTADQDRIIDMMIDQFGEPQVFDVERAEIEGEVIAEQGLPPQSSEKETLEARTEKGGWAIDPEEQRVEKELTGKNFMQVAQWAVDSAPNAFYRTIAQKVQARLREYERKGVEFDFTLHTGPSRSAGMRNRAGAVEFTWEKSGSPKNSKMEMHINGAAVIDNQAGYAPGVQYDTILHELLHAAIRTQTRFMSKTDPLYKELMALDDKVLTAFNEQAKAKTLPPVMMEYYRRENNILATPDELISWGMTDKGVQEWLDSIKVGDKSVLTKLVELMRKVLGLGKPYESAFEKLVRTTDSLLDVDVGSIEGNMSDQGFSMAVKKVSKQAGKPVQQSLFRKAAEKDTSAKVEATPEAEPAKDNPTRQNIFGEPVLGTWSITVDPKMELQDGLIYKMLDKNIDVKRIVEAVKSTGKQIASQWNPYLQEELYHGRTANASQEFQDKEWLPLLQDMDKKGVTIGELEKYLLNRHAEEYNKLVAKRNPDRPEMQDGGSSVNTADAQKYLSSLDKDTKAKYEELAKRIDGITKGTRQLLVDTGYEKAETIKGWEKAFPNYVPLMREEANFDYNFGSFGTGRGFDVRRDFSRSAMGSKRNVVDIIGNVISARNNAIALTEKNRVAQAVYGLALEAPNPDFWMAINPDAEKVPADAIDELRAMGLDEEAVKYLMKEPKQRMLDPKKDQIVSRVNTKLRENDYVLATRVNGEKRYVFFNQKDPRAERAATALKNLGAQDLGVALGLIAKVTRWMASVNTQYNPIFGPYNFLRDIQSAALQLSTTELAGQQKEIAANVVPSLRVIYSSLRKRRKGEAVTGDDDFLKMADLWKEFQKEGGQTGFRDNFSRTQDRTEALLNEMEKITEGKVKANARAVFDWLSDYNDSLENAVRLSAYKVAKEKFKKEGFSDSEAKQKAASLAKNLTVNFNRKGDVATQMGALYAFFNASMQGTARMIETLKGPTGKKIMAGGLLLGSMQAALLAAAGFDDEEPPEFIRSKNIVIPTGDGDYVAFPMPLGFHVIPGASRILTEWTLSGFKDTARRVTDLTGLFLDAFNPIGNAGWSVQTITPTILDPLVALGENKDWTGKPISKEDIFSLRPTPGYTRAREGANFLSTNLAEFLNYASGGTKHQPGVLSPTPEQIEYLVGQAFGGVGREAIKLATTVEKTATGEDLPPYKIPLYGRFVGETKSSAAESNKFYKNMERLNRLDLEIKGRREDREPIGDFMRENPESRLLPMANKTYKDVQALRKRRAALVERNAPKESVQAVEKMITRKMQVLNDRVRALEERN